MQQQQPQPPPPPPPRPGTGPLRPSADVAAPAAAGGWWLWTSPLPSAQPPGSCRFAITAANHCQSGHMAILLQLKCGSPPPARAWPRLLTASPCAPWAKKPPNGSSRIHKRENLGCASRPPLVTQPVGPPLALGLRCPSIHLPNRPMAAVRDLLRLQAVSSR
jgi:hypothetical protein